jgi:adenylate cyclase
MTDIFISYARSTAPQAQAIAEALRALGYGVWRDDELPAHRAYAEVIEERLKAAKAVVVVWSAEAAKSQWVFSEANRAREDGKLVQLSLDDTRLPMPFDSIQCADLAGWSGELDAPGWRKVAASIAELTGGTPAVAAPVAGTQPPPLPSKPSIAVLPFANLSGDPEQDYFADGMVEEIARALSRFKSIFVIGGGSGLSFKGKATTSQEAARMLGVRYVPEGSVRKAANRVRVAVKLIDSTDGAQIWADRFEDTLEDVFALQDKVALEVGAVIEPAMREVELRRSSSRPTEQMGSYDLFLRGLAHYRTYGRNDILLAVDLFKRAVSLDADYGAALAMAALCQALVVVFGWADDLENRLADVKTLSERAIKVAAEDPDVLSLVTTTMLMIGEDLQTAAALADRAMVLNPGSTVVWAAKGVVSFYDGRFQQAYEDYESALRLDPLSPNRTSLIGMQGAARFAQRRFADAVPLLKQSAQLMPEWALNQAVLVACYGHLGELDAARDAMARFDALSAVSIRDWASAWPMPDLRQLLLDGIALSEGGRPQGN